MRLIWCGARLYVAKNVISSACVCIHLHALQYVYIINAVRTAMHSLAWDIYSMHPQRNVVCYEPTVYHYIFFFFVKVSSPYKAAVYRHELQQLPRCSILNKNTKPTRINDLFAIITVMCSTMYTRTVVYKK